MIEIVPKSPIDVGSLKVLREISSLSISEIKKASIEETPICRLEIFGRTWDEAKSMLIKIHKLYSLASGAPFIVLETDSSMSEVLSPVEFTNKLKFWRSIELESQKNLDLENGYIDRSEDFAPHDENWI